MKWNFPSNNNGDINGISNPGIETFQGTPLKSLAREICQNSLDATIDSKVTKVEFKLFCINNKDIPDFEGLKNVFALSESFWRKQRSNKAKDFFNRALNVSNSDSIPIMRISDFNTRGLEGSKGEYNTPWCNLTKSSGTSDKSGANSGSFGIGKFAPFACSDLRTVYYNTLDIENEKAFQGIARLASYKNENAEITTGVGYFGERYNKPIHKQISLDKSFDRTEIGTDIYILGFKYQDWINEIILSILDGFLFSVFSEKLIVNINDQILINKDNLYYLISEYGDSSKEYLLDYYDVLTSKETVWYTTNFKNKGLIHLGLIIKENLKKRVAMVRKSGMKIKDQGNLSSFIPFAGLLYIEGEEINSYLRIIENPEHTKWQPERENNAVRVSEAREFLRTLNAYLKECLNKLNILENGDYFDPNIGDLLPLDKACINDINNIKIESITDEIKMVQHKTKKIIKPRENNLYKKIEENSANTVQSNSDIDGVTAVGGIDEGKNNKKTSGKGNGNDIITNTNISFILANKVRVLCINKMLGEYSIIYTPTIDADSCYLKIFQIAETDRYELDIKNVKGFGENNEVIKEGNMIKNIKFRKDIPIRLKVSFDTNEYYALEVDGYGSKI